MRNPTRTALKEVPYSQNGDDFGLASPRHDASFDADANASEASPERDHRSRRSSAPSPLSFFDTLPARVRRNGPPIAVEPAITEELAHRMADLESIISVMSKQLHALHIHSDGLEEARISTPRQAKQGVGQSLADAMQPANTRWALPAIGDMHSNVLVDTMEQSNRLPDHPIDMHNSALRLVGQLQHALVDCTRNGNVADGAGRLLGAGLVRLHNIVSGPHGFGAQRT